MGYVQQAWCWIFCYLHLNTIIRNRGTHEDLLRLNIIPLTNNLYSLRPSLTVQGSRSSYDQFLNESYKSHMKQKKTNKLVQNSNRSKNNILGLRQAKKKKSVGSFLFHVWFNLSAAALKYIIFKEHPQKCVEWSASLTAAAPAQCLFKTEAFVCAKLKQSRLSQRTALKIGAGLFLQLRVAGLLSPAPAFLSRSDCSTPSALIF